MHKVEASLRRERPERLIEPVEEETVDCRLVLCAIDGRSGALAYGIHVPHPHSETWVSHGYMLKFL